MERLARSEQRREKTSSRSAARTPLCAEHVRKVLESTDYSDPMVLSTATESSGAEPRTPDLAGEARLGFVSPRLSRLAHWPARSELHAHDHEARADQAGTGRVRKSPRPSLLFSAVTDLRENV